jgi:hypothetical protein
MLESDGFKRRAALRAFNEAPEVRVFLLSLRHGAAGLTLVSGWVSRRVGAEEAQYARAHTVHGQRALHVKSQGAPPPTTKKPLLACLLPTCLLECWLVPPASTPICCNAANKQRV